MTTEIKIDKNVPLPEFAPRHPRSKALMALKVKESFEIAFSLSAQASVHVDAKRFGIKVRTRRNGDMLRVWRVK